MDCSASDNESSSGSSWNGTSDNSESASSDLHSEEYDHELLDSSSDNEDSEAGGTSDEQSLTAGTSFTLRGEASFRFTELVSTPPPGINTTMRTFERQVNKTVSRICRSRSVLGLSQNRRRHRQRSPFAP